MKILSILFLTLLMAKGCDPKVNEEMKNTEIEYTAISRGKYLNINIHDERLSITDKRDGKARNYELKSKDWNDLAALYQKIDIKKLPTFKAPTQKRFYDGAAIANLHVVYDGKVYDSESFDHGTPPVEIADFVNKIVSFATPSTQAPNAN